jgi:hypothetical protein
MNPNNPDFDAELKDPVRRAKDDFKTISDIREKLEALAEHVQNRKEALDEEIQERLHEAIANARDSLERIQENIEPKLEKTIREKLAELDARLADWKKDFRNIVRDELDARSGALAKTVEDALEAKTLAKTANAALRQSIRTEMTEEIRAAVEKHAQNAAEEMRRLRQTARMALALGALALLSTLGMILLLA